VVVDAHQHVWEPSRGWYDWLTPATGRLHADHTQPDVEPQRAAAGVDQVVLVQAANKLDETRYLLDVAERFAAVTGVVGWVPLDDAEQAAAALSELAAEPTFCGVRHLVHDEPDPDWVVRPDVLEGLQVLAAHDVPFDLVAVTPRHLEHAVTLLDRVPGLRLVIDHLGKPPIGSSGWQPWASLLAAAADSPRCFAKISGLDTTTTPEQWSASHVRRYVDHAVASFGPQRLMVGSDWPMCAYGVGYGEVWRVTRATFDGWSADDVAAVMGGTATAFYGLDRSVGVNSEGARHE
jgi:L-fuconolactonase